MIEVVARQRYSRLQALLEALDFDMDALPHAARHQLLQPDKARLFGLFDPGPDEKGVHHGSDVVEGEEYLGWNAHAVREIEAGSSRSCLWEFVQCADAPPSDLLSFVTQWGLLEDPGTLSGGGSYVVDDFRRESRLMRSVLVALLTTEAGELVNDSTLDDLGSMTYFDLYRLEEGDEIARQLGIPIEQVDTIPDGYVIPIAQELRRNRWHAECAGGQGLLLQANLIATLLNTEVGASEGSFIWDLNGRRVERVATGVKAISWSHLAALFTASFLDAYVCDMCGRPYEFLDSVARRRPRKGTRRFCSDQCRLDAKRESNRRSWKRNAVRWRPSTGRRDENGSQS